MGSLHEQNPKIISHEHPYYQRKWNLMTEKHNGAFYYSREIVDNIIPRVKTDRNWITINIPNVGASHSIVFIHNNLSIEPYRWLRKYDDLVLVCGVESTCQKVAPLGRSIYLPLSVDVREVKKYIRPKDKDVAFVGRKQKRMRADFPRGTDYIEGLPRGLLLSEMARYKAVYAVGRVALEAKILGCEVLPYDPRFPDPDIWKILDNKDAAKLLQQQLDVLP